MAILVNALQLAISEHSDRRTRAVAALADIFHIQSIFLHGVDNNSSRDLMHNLANITLDCLNLIRIGAATFNQHDMEGIHISSERKTM